MMRSPFTSVLLSVYDSGESLCPSPESIRNQIYSNFDILVIDDGGRRTGTMIVHREHETGVVPRFMESVLDLRRAGRIAEVLRTVVLCMRLHPLNPYDYKPLPYSLARFGGIKRYRCRRAKRL